MQDVTQYNSPAQASFINTYSPIPFSELMQAGTIKAKQYDQGVENLMQTYDDTNNLKYIPNSKDEQYIKGVVVPHVKSVIDKYSNEDLSDPIIRRQMRMELNNGIDKQRIRSIQDSFEGYKQYIGEKMKLQQKNMLSPLEGTPHKDWDTSTQGTFQHLPSEWSDPIKELQERYFKGLETQIVRDKHGNPITDPRGYYTAAITANRIDQESRTNLANALATPAGRNAVALYRQQYGESVANKSDAEVLYKAMLDAGHKYIQDKTEGSPWTERELKGRDEKESYDGVGRLQGISLVNTRIDPEAFKLIKHVPKSPSGTGAKIASNVYGMANPSEENQQYHDVYNHSLLDKPEVKDLINLLPKSFQDDVKMLKSLKPNTEEKNPGFKEAYRQVEDRVFGKLNEIYSNVSEHMNKSPYYIKANEPLSKKLTNSLFGPSSKLSSISGGNFTNAKVLKVNGLKPMNGKDFYDKVIKEAAKDNPDGNVVAVGKVHPDNVFGHPAVTNDPDYRKGVVVTVEGENYIIAPQATSNYELNANKTYHQMIGMPGVELSEPDIVSKDRKHIISNLTELKTEATDTEPAMFIFKHDGKVIGADIEFDNAYNQANEYIHSLLK